MLWGRGSGGGAEHASGWTETILVSLQIPHPRFETRPIPQIQIYGSGVLSLFTGIPPGPGFASRHPGGAQFLRVDGSVDFLSETVDQSVLEASATRAKGEIGGL